MAQVELDLPLQYENAILAYLKEQEVDLDNEERILPPSISPSQQFVRNFLEDLLLRVDKHTMWRERYREMKREHNQHIMFDIMDYIPEFCLDDDILELMTFRENLLICSIDPIPICTQLGTLNAVGALSLDVQWAEGKIPKNPIKDCDTFDRELLAHCKQIKEYVAKAEEKKSDRERLLCKQIEELESLLKKKIMNEHHKFLVHVSSKFHSGLEGGSEISAWVNRDMHTVEEKRREYVVEESDMLNQKTLYVGMQHNKYYVRHTSTQDSLDKRRYYSMIKMKSYISEGANFVLMRYIILSKYIGTFEVSTLYIEGGLCRNIYESKGPRIVTIDGKNIEAYKIHRTIIENCGVVHRVSTLFSAHGRIITQEWEGSQYILNINPRIDLDNSVFLPKFEYVPLHEDWQEDMELLSKYMQYKTEAELKLNTYMTDHPEVKEIISDYMQHILLLKPSKVVDFSCEYFKKLLPSQSYNVDMFGDDEEQKFYMTI